MIFAVFEDFGEGMEYRKKRGLFIIIEYTGIFKIHITNKSNGVQKVLLTYKNGRAANKTPKQLSNAI